MARPYRIATLLCAMPGLAALFMPFLADGLFGGGSSPLNALLSGANDKWLSSAGSLAIPFYWFAGAGFLAIPIAIWELRSLQAAKRSSLEIALAYILSAAAMSSVVRATPAIWKTHNVIFSVLGPSWALLFGNFVLLASARFTTVTREQRAELFLIGGYLPNAALCLTEFSGYGLGPGGVMVIVACIAYVVAMISLLLRRAT
jgi:hypothetical protein